MSSDVVVHAEGIGKKFQIGQFTRNDLLSEKLLTFASTFGRGRTRRPDFWALTDVDFEVRRGETLGIIGHNGAGKSTLLKVLSRVTPPTKGSLNLEGRVGALLEVGTGFHPELTGRENIFLNGAVLGMRRAEILRRFDEIVEFAEVTQFVDTPVKRYSSGMNLRLAFAVAAHLEPEILIVDEVLAVGDMAFQEKCLGRMERVADEGRTVLFVSHNLAAVASLCPRSILLSGGRKVADGPTPEVIEQYSAGVTREAERSLDHRTDRQGSGRLRFTSVHWESGGRELETPAGGQPIELCLGYEVEGPPIQHLNANVNVHTVFGELMLHLNTVSTGLILRDVGGTGQLRCRLDRFPLAAGQYTVDLWADAGGDTLDSISRASTVTVIEGDYFGTGWTPNPAYRTAVFTDNRWELLSD